MAYVTKELKAKVQKKLKAIMPKACKWSISGTGRGRLSLNIWVADEDLIGAVNRHNQKMHEWHGWIIPEKPLTHVDLGGASIRDVDFGRRWNGILAKAWEAMNEGNWDRSDVQTDYFDVGWYCAINLGTWDRPFQTIEKTKAA
ncbi:hypothetical protein HF288_06305 [Acidithiobacillus caldus]|jgi:hypothetical protein|uniref:hypothetical protein n=1 Tax=Acidithiobacillus caldus TaxID=33059 RepID=UPI001C07024E|nr:hypothetical protein [Acidithiobacillus caldus]MBU2790048.1 hypothetical protein [Acidithiobacillus caldus]MBU2820931.1 hypothetical protein [Acidithiobacillus caldus]